MKLKRLPHFQIFLRNINQDLFAKENMVEKLDLRAPRKNNLSQLIITHLNINSLKNSFDSL